jgi:topoisomerase-4 subunit B
VLNTYEVDATGALRQREVHDIAVALGIDPHAPTRPTPVLDNLRYGKVDHHGRRDVDGSHIQTLLLTLFYKHFPKLIERGHVFIAQAPLYSIRVAPTARSRRSGACMPLDEAEREQALRSCATRASVIR